MKDSFALPESGSTLSLKRLNSYSLSARCAGLSPVTNLRLEKPGRIPGEIEVSVPSLHYRSFLRLQEISNRPLGLSPERPGAATDALLESLESTHEDWIEIWREGDMIHRAPITLLPWKAWSHDREQRIASVSFVQPFNEWVLQLSARVCDDDATQCARKLFAELGRMDRPIAYRPTRARHTTVAGSTYQSVTMPAALLDPSRDPPAANCFDLTVLMAACLEACGHSPLLIFTGELDHPPDHVFLGWWTDNNPRHRPVLTDPAFLRERMESGELNVLETTRVCSGEVRAAWDDAGCHARVRVTSDEAGIHALDVVACRPPRGNVRPLVLAMAPMVRIALEAAHGVAEELHSSTLETVHLLYGVCAAKGVMICRLLLAFDVDPLRVVDFIERSLNGEHAEGPPRVTSGWEKTIATMRATARSHSSDRVEEIHLLWALLEPASRNVRRVLEAVGIDVDALGLVLAELASEHVEVSRSRSFHDQIEDSR